MKTTAFVKDLDEFRAYADKQGKQTVWGNALMSLARTSASEAELEETLFEDVPSTFGWNLMRAVANKDPQRAIIDFFKEHRQQINDLEPKRRSEISLLANDILIKPYGRKEWNAEDTSVKDWLLSLKQTIKKDDFGDLVLKAKRIENLNKLLQDESQLQTKMNALIRSDRKKAKVVFFKLVKLLEPVSNTNGPFGGGYGGGFGGFLDFFDPTDSVGSHLLNTLFENHDSEKRDAKEVAFVLDVLNSADRKIDASGDFRYSFQHMLNGFHSNANNQTKDDQIKAVYRELGKEIGDLPSSILAGSLFQLLQSTSDKTAIIEWAEKEANSGTYPDLAAEFLAAARFKHAIQERNQTPNEQLRTESYSHYLALMSDDSLPVSWREQIANVVLQGMQPSPKEDFIYAAIAASKIGRHQLGGRMRSRVISICLSFQLLDLLTAAFCETK